MRMPVPENSVWKTQRAGRAKNTSAGSISAEVERCFVHSFKATASSQVFLLPFPKYSIALSGTPNFWRIFTLRSVSFSNLVGPSPFTRETRTLCTSPFAWRFSCHDGSHIVPAAKHNDGIRRRDRIRNDLQIGGSLK